MLLYRLLTEATGEMRENAIRLTAARFMGFTVLDSTGYWKGQREASVVIEIMVPNADLGTQIAVSELAAEIGAVNKQESVCVQMITLDGHSMVAWRWDNARNQRDRSRERGGPA